MSLIFYTSLFYSSFKITDFLIQNFLFSLALTQSAGKQAICICSMVKHGHKWPYNQWLNYPCSLSSHLVKFSLTADHCFRNFLTVRFGRSLPLLSQFDSRKIMIEMVIFDHDIIPLYKLSRANQCKSFICNIHLRFSLIQVSFVFDSERLRIEKGTRFRPRALFQLLLDFISAASNSPKSNQRNRPNLSIICPTKKIIIIYILLII